jgi:hypothetical protein
VELLARSTRLTQLTTLDLHETLSGVPEGHRLGGLMRIEKLKLSGNNLSARGLEEFFSGNPSTNLNELDLGVNLLADEGLQILARMPGLDRLQRLRVNANQIGNPGLRAFAESRQFPALEFADLTNNPIGDEGIRYLVESERLPKLRQILCPAIGISFRLRQALLTRFPVEAEEGP